LVYHYCTDKLVTYLPERLRGTSTEQLKCYNYSVHALQCFPLMQVCRQIRTEFSPIYATNAEIHVGHLDLLQFVVEKSHTAHNKSGNIIGDIFVDSIEDTHRKCRFLNHFPVDILTLLEYCKAKPGLVIQPGENDCGCDDCTWDWSGIGDYMTVLFSINTNPKLQAWLADAVTSVWLRLPAGLTFDVKGDIFQHWMRAWPEYLDGTADGTDFFEWVSETGLHFPRFRAAGNIWFHQV
jgi:hypothetical protein